MHGVKLVSLFTVLLATGVAVSAYGASAQADGRTVYLNETPVFVVATPQRATLLAERLTNSSLPGELQAKIAGDSALVTLDGKTLAEVLPEDAGARDPMVVAREWAANLRMAMTLPPIRFGAAEIAVPLGETRVLTLVGREAKDAKLAIAGGVVTFQRKPGEIILKGLARGGGTLTAQTASGLASTIRIDVKPFAASLPQTVEAAVSGVPAQSDTVRGAILSALMTGLRTQPDSDIRLVSTNATQLAVGDNRTFEARVRVYAPDAFVSEGVVRVKVQNDALPQRDEDELWYCNDPETVKKPGALFAAELKPDVSARLLYHHANGTNNPLFMQILAVNDSDVPARVLIIPGDSAPERSPIKAGFKAAEQFLSGWVNASGEVATIAPHSCLPISTRRLYPGQTMSGLCRLHLLPGGPKSVLVRADAKPPFSVDAKWASALLSATPWRCLGQLACNSLTPSTASLTEFVYPNPSQNEEVKYEVGGKFKFVRIGGTAIERRDKQDSLDGNYGVLYTIKALISNPTEKAADTDITVEASAGFCSGLFLIDGKLVKVPSLATKAEALIARIRLEAGATRWVTLKTIPLSGSPYPVTLAFKPAGSNAKYSSTRIGDRS